MSSVFSVTRRAAASASVIARRVAVSGAAAAGLLMAFSGPAHTANSSHERDGMRFDTGPLPAFVEDRPLPERWDPKAPGADDRSWRNWRLDRQVDRRQGRDIVYSDYAYEPKAPSLLGEAGKFEVVFNPEFQTLTLHAVEVRRDGRWQDRLVPDKIQLARREEEFEQDMTNGSVSALIVLEDVRVDDVVRIRYSVTGSNPIMGGQLSEWALLGWRNPLLQSGTRVLYDPGTEVAFHRENTDITPTVRSTADAVEASVRVQGAAPVIDENGYPVWYQPYPRVEIAPKRSWADVVGWALPLYPEHTAPFDPVLEAKIAQWRTLRDPAARMTAALREVQNEVRYFGVEIGDNTHRPNPPDQVWRKRYGDCKDKTLLLVTLLRRLDIEAAPALVSVGRGRAIGQSVPSASVFDHVIVRARIDGRTWWLDPTIAQQGGDPRQADLSDYGLVLPVTAGSTALEPVAAPADAATGVEMIERFEPAADGSSATFTVETIYTGLAADRQRRSTLGERRDEVSRRYAEFYRKRYGELEVLDTPAIEDDFERNVVRIRERYRLNAPFDTAGGGVRALDAYADALQDTSTLPQQFARSGPLDYVEPGRYRHSVRVRVPERWKPAFRAESVDRSGPAFRFERKVEVTGDEVRLVYDMQVKQSEVAVEQVPAHLEALRKVRDALSATLRFNIPASLDDAQRRQRLRALLQDVIDGEPADKGGKAP